MKKFDRESTPIDKADLSAWLPPVARSRRQFLAATAKGACALCLAHGFFSAMGGGAGGFGASLAFAEDIAPPPQSGEGETTPNSEVFVAPALHWEPLEGGRVRCTLCPRRCSIQPGRRGGCRVRENREGKLVTLVHGRIVSLNLDPIEKKPFNHVLPGAATLSLATAGCNIACQFCQNWQISQVRPEELPATHIPPAKMAELAKTRKAPVLAYTYSEPVVQFENMLETARAAKALGVRNIMISNGYIQEKPMAELCEVLDAVKIDFKGFSPTFYRDVCRAEMKPVLDTLKLVKGKGVWLELVCLVVPTLNDTPAECERMCAWILENLGPDVPVHFTRFSPNYKMRNLPATPPLTLERNREIARKAGIHFAYTGNLAGHEYESTYCPGCGAKVITRHGYISESHLADGACAKCQRKIPGVWS